MNWEAIGAIGSIVGSVAVVCTLAYLALQMKQNTKALTTSMYETAMGGFNEVIGFLNNDPMTSSLMRRGWLDPSSLSVEETYRFSMLVRYYSNHVYKLFRLYEGGVFPAHEWKRTAREAAQFFYLLPAGVAFREKNEYYEDLWSELVRHEGASSISDFVLGAHAANRNDSERSKP